MILQNTSTPTPPPKKTRRIWLYLVIFLVFVLAACAGALFASTSLLDKKELTPEEEHLLTAKDKATIMIMGVDQRTDDVGRSDTLMIATIDPKKNQAALLSLPRDTRVKIKGHGYDKINAAYAYGGHKLTEDTVEDFIGVRVDHYVIINTHSFQRIIDAIGGVDIDVEKRMFYEDPWDDDGGLVIDLQPGMQHMDGKTAVTYVRYRDEEGDIGRIGRQLKFMKAVMDKVASPSIIAHLPSIIREVMGSVETDLSFRQLLEFAGTLKEAQKNGLKTDMVPGRPLYISGISYWIPDVLKLRQTVASTLDIDLDSTMRANMERASHEYERSIPAGATEVPEGDYSIGRAPKRESSDSNRPGSTKKTQGRETPAAADSDSSSGRRSSSQSGSSDSSSSSGGTGSSGSSSIGGAVSPGINADTDARGSTGPVGPAPVPDASPQKTQ